MKNTRSTLIILICTLLLGMGVAWYIRTKPRIITQYVPPVESLLPPIPTSTNELPTEELPTPKYDTWRTYKATSYEIKYPSTYSIYIIISGPSLRIPSENDKSDFIFIAKNNRVGYDFSQAPLEISIIGYSASIQTFDALEQNARGKPDYKYKRIWLDGKQALEIESEYAIDTYLIHDNKLYDVHINKNKYVFSSQEINEAKLVVSTFSLK